MRKYEMRDVPARKEKTCVHVSCDICGYVSSSPAWPWGKGSYCIEDVDVKMVVEVKHESGDSFPEGGRSNTKSFDICPGCFDEVLVPFIEAKGKCKVDEEEKDW